MNFLVLKIGVYKLYYSHIELDRQQIWASLVMLVHILEVQ